MSTRPCSDIAAVDQRVDVGALRHVGALHHRGAAVGLDLVGGRLRAGLVDVAADDRGARRRERGRARLADAAADAGEHRHLPREVEHLLRAGHTAPIRRISVPSDGTDGRGAYARRSRSAPRAQHNGPVHACGNVPALLALGSRFNDVSVFAYLAAFGGGIISFLSPCVLPLVPAYLSMVTGLDLATLQDGAKAQQRRVIRTTSLFVLGFGSVFVLLGLSVSSVGPAPARPPGPADARSPARSCVAMGLFLLGSLFLQAPWLYQEKRFQPQLGRFGDAAPVVAGVAFGFGWSPCIGPILGSILAIAGTQDRIWAGATLLVAYTLGLGLPFLVTGLALGRVGGALSWVKRHFPLLVGTAAVVLIAFGVVLMFDQLSRVTSEMQQALDGTPFEWLVQLG